LDRRIKVLATRSRPNAIAQAQTRIRAADTGSTGFAPITVISSMIEDVPNGGPIWLQVIFDIAP
jgi:hypothetical protein